jgi:uncharacterized membrane protein
MALAAAVLFGAAAPFAKLLLGAVEPQLLAGLLYIGAGIGLAAVHFGRAALGVRAPEAPLRAGDLPWLAAVAVFGGVLGPLLLMLGLARTDAASGSLLLNLEGLFTMGIAWLVFRENVDRRLLLGALAILAGAAVLSWGGRGVEVDTGAVLIAASCLAWGIDNNLTRKLSSADPVLTAMIKGLTAGAVKYRVCRAGWRSDPGGGHSRRLGHGRLRRDRDQPRALRAGIALSRNGAHRRLFFARAVYRGGVGSRPLARGGDREPRARRSLDGVRAMDASRRTPRARASARGVRTRAQP